MRLEKKTWRTGGLLVVLAGLAIAYGIASREYKLFPYAEDSGLKDSAMTPTGLESKNLFPRWGRVRKSSDLGSLDQATLDNLIALGYLSGYTSAERMGGVTLVEPEEVQGGLTLFTSGHAPVMYLISLAGDLVYQWEVELAELWPDDLPFEPAYSRAHHKNFIRRARVFPNGDILGVFEYLGIFKLDKHSNVLWQNLSQNHHDLDIAPDGSILTLVRQHLTQEEVAQRFPGLKCPASGIFEDQIAILSSSGQELKRVSILKALYRSEYAAFLPTSVSEDQAYDLFHTNSIDFVDFQPGKPGIRSGEVVVSLRSMDAILSIDLEAERVTWMMTGKSRAQHQAQLLRNGNVLLLDNRGGNPITPLKLNQSQVLEVDPQTQEVAWRYRGSAQSPFFTPALGYVQRLENGNTLVTESMRGRIFEVTREGRIVWDFMNPHRAGDEEEFIANIFGAQRINAEELDFIDR